jgi:crotonobetainyl-CoA:carnitine CoA-transferase CaiB-like acyl-CoA transferase
MQSFLDGVKILNLAPWLPGLYCRMLLADLGADVILIEHPSGKERAERPPGYLSIVNRNKRSMTLDLKVAKGKEIFTKLVAKSDVFIEGLRPGTVNQLGIGYEDLKKINSSLVFCSISGYGQKSPYKERPAHNNTYVGMASMVQSFPNDPIAYNPHVSIADLAAAMFASLSIIAALRVKDREGSSQFIEVPIVDCAVSWMCQELGTFYNTGQGRPEAPASGFYKTSDGKYLSLSVGASDKLWRNLCKAIGLTNLSEMTHLERENKFGEIEASLREIICHRTREEWLKLLAESDVPFGQVLTLRELITDPHIKSRSLIVEVEDNRGQKEKQVAYPIKFSGKQLAIKKFAPKLGENTEEILKDLGFNKNEIRILKREMVI